MSMKSTSLARLLSVEVPGQANILTQILHLFHRLNECFKIEIGFLKLKDVTLHQVQETTVQNKDVKEHYRFI